MKCRFLMPALPWAVALFVASGCGEKITVPEAVGIPSLSSYVDVTPDNLNEALSAPSDVVEYFGRILVADADSNHIMQVQSDGDVDLEAQPPIKGFQRPVAMALYELTRLVYVGEVDGGVVSIAILDLVGGLIESRIDFSSTISSIESMTTDGSWLYVSDSVLNVVHRIELLDEGVTLNHRGFVCTDAGSVESPQFVLDPQGLSMDFEGKLLVCDADTTRNWVLRFDPAPPEGEPDGLGTAITFDGSTCSGGTPSLDAFTLGLASGCGETFEQPGPSDLAGAFAFPGGVTADASGRIYTADTGNGRIQRFSASGEFDLQFGYDLGAGDGLVSPARIATWHADQDNDGNIADIPAARVFVVDRGESILRVYEDQRFSGAGR